MELLPKQYSLSLNSLYVNLDKYTTFFSPSLEAILHDALDTFISCSTSEVLILINPADDTFTRLLDLIAIGLRDSRTSQNLLQKFVRALFLTVSDPVICHYVVDDTRIVSILIDRIKILDLSSSVIDDLLKLIYVLLDACDNFSSLHLISLVSFTNFVGETLANGVANSYKLVPLLALMCKFEAVVRLLLESAYHSQLLRLLVSQIDRGLEHPRYLLSSLLCVCRLSANELKLFSGSQLDQTLQIISDIFRIDDSKYTRLYALDLLHALICEKSLYVRISSSSTFEECIEQCLPLLTSSEDLTSIRANLVITAFINSENDIDWFLQRFFANNECISLLCSFLQSRSDPEVYRSIQVLTLNLLAESIEKANAQFGKGFITMNCYQIIINCISKILSRPLKFEARSIAATIEYKSKALSLLNFILTCEQHDDVIKYAAECCCKCICALVTAIFSGSYFPLFKRINVPWIEHCVNCVVQSLRFHRKLYDASVTEVVDDYKTILADERIFCYVARALVSPESAISASALRALFHVSRIFPSCINIESIAQSLCLFSDPINYGFCDKIKEDHRKADLFETSHDSGFIDSLIDKIGTFTAKDAKLNEVLNLYKRELIYAKLREKNLSSMLDLQNALHKKSEEMMLISKRYYSESMTQNLRCNLLLEETSAASSQMQCQISSAERKYADAKKLSDDLSKNLSELKVQHEKTEKEKSDLIAEIKKLKHDNNKIEKRLKIVTTDLEKVNTSFETYKQKTAFEIKHRDEQIEKITEELNGVRNELTIAENERDEFSAAIDDLSNLRMQDAQVIERLKSEISSLESKIREHDEQLRAKVAENSVLRADVDRYITLINTIKGLTVSQDS